MEKRVNDLIADGERTKQAAEETARYTAIQNALREAGVQKVDLAFRAVRDDIRRNDAGDLVSLDGKPLGEAVAAFVKSNPEFLPARIAGGSGATHGQPGAPASNIDLNDIRPGMTKEQSAAAWAAVRSALQS